MPYSDMLCIANVLCSLQDEIYALRTELEVVRNEREKDLKVLEKSECIMKELSDIKILMSTKSEQGKYR